MDDSATPKHGNPDFYWRCGEPGCDYLSPHGEHQDQLNHAKDEHGSFDAVSWSAVAPFEVDNALSERSEHEK